MIRGQGPHYTLFYAAKIGTIEIALFNPPPSIVQWSPFQCEGLSLRGDGIILTIVKVEQCTGLSKRRGIKFCDGSSVSSLAALS